MKKCEETRARILAAAMRLVARKGPSSTRTADLAAEAGVSEGAIFRYFPTKAHIVEAVFRELLARYTPELQRILENDSGQSELAVLESIIDFHFAFFTKEENLALIVPALIEQESFDNRLMTKMRNELVPLITRITGMIERGMERGVFRTGDPSLMVMALFGLMYMSIFHKLLTGATYSFDEARAEAKRFFFVGIQSDRAAAEKPCS